MRTSFPAWMAFLLCITTSIKASWQILNDLPDTLAESQSELSPVLPTRIPIAIQENPLPVFVPVYIEKVIDMDTPEKLWFQSVLHEDSAQQSIYCEESQAFQALSKAKDAIGEIVQKRPDFHPDLVVERLENLENLKKEWVSENKVAFSRLDKFYKNREEDEDVETLKKGSLPDYGGRAVGSLFPSSLPHYLSSAKGEAVGDPSSTWFRAFQSAGQARQSEDRGDECSAFEKYEEAMNLYRGIWEKYPEFQSELITKRIQILSEKLEQLTEQPSAGRSRDSRGKSLTD